MNNVKVFVLMAGLASAHRGPGSTARSHRTRALTG
jgi:hypothetical protein